MLVISTLPALRYSIHKARIENKRISLVPTMGNLHEGHMQLVSEAKIHSDIVIVSIFINPMQFDCADDLERYPRTFKEDCEKLSAHHVDFVFTPALKDIYPEGTQESTYVDVPRISTILEGKQRPGHFRGVSTIISKLFNLVQPDVACFGEKDYQQLMLIRKMVVDMNYHIDIIGVPTVRAKDGLALSSRNSYLTVEQRKIAPVINMVINMISNLLCTSKLSIESLIHIAEQTLNEKGFKDNDVKILDANKLAELTDNTSHAVILVASLLGKARLIDNKVVKL